MFGKKKGGAEPVKKTKNRKSSGAQSRFGGGGIKVACAKHIEKILMATIALAALLIVFSSYSREGLDANHSPEKLDSAISSAQANYQRNTWTEVHSQRYPRPDNYLAQASADAQAVRPDDYKLTQAWEPLTWGLPVKRHDAELVPLQELEVTYGFGSLAIVPPPQNRPRLLNEDRQTLFEEQKGIRELPDEWVGRMRRNFQPPPEAKLQPQRFVCITGLIPLKAQFKQYRDTFFDSDGYLSERDFPKYMARFQVERAEVGADGQLAAWELIWGAETEDDRSPQEKSAQELLRKTLRLPPPDELAKHDSVEFLTVMPLPPLVNRDLSIFATHSKIGLQRDFERQLMEEQMNYQGQEMQGPSPWTGTKAPGDGMGADSAAVGGYGGGYGGGGYGGYGGGGYGANSEGGGYGGYGGGGYGPPSGYGSGYGSSSDGGYGGYGGGYGSSSGYGSGYGGASSDGGGYGGGGGGYGGYGGGGYGGGGYGGGGYGGGGYGGGGYAGREPVFDDDGNPIGLPDYKLFRFFDFTVRSGKSYRYRVRLSLEDPNEPQNPMARPPVRHLDGSVILRLRKQNAEKKTEDRVYWRLTDWCEPSDVVSISRNEKILAGEVTAPPPTRVKLGDDQIVSYDKATSEPQVDAIIVAYDEEKSGDIPSEKTSLRRGSVANFASKKKVEMIDPLMMMLKEVDQHRFRSDIMVVDILGGDPLPSGRGGKDKLKTPGEMLVLTPDGQLEVHEEINDSRELYYNTFPEPDPRYGAYGVAGAGDEDEDSKGRRGRSRRSGYGSSGYGDGYGQPPQRGRRSGR